MAIKFWSDGICKHCEMHTLQKCDGCRLFVCESHSREIKKGDIKLHICLDCQKGLKPGVKVGGVILTKKALSE